MRISLVTLAFIVGASAPVRAQDSVIVVPTEAHSDTQFQRVADEMFSRTVQIDLQDVPLGTALHMLGQRAGLDISYSASVAPVSLRLSLVAEHITVRDALTQLLHGTGLRATVAAHNMIVVGHARPDSTVRYAQTGTLSGAISDSATGSGVPFALVRIDETGQRTNTNTTGHYTIANVVPGTYHVSARRVGYTVKTRTVTIVDDQTTTQDFVLSRPPTRLDEIVTTALGDQRRLQIGNDIGSINVDSVTPTTPVLSLTDVISARIPGVQVQESEGLVGAGPALRIRGNGSLTLQGDPIIVIDGVRQDNTAGGVPSTLFSGGDQYYGAVSSPSRLNDIDFTDVETIDVLKGPSASTEYGTDAANGVIVIKTKHSQAGAPRWSLSAEQGFSELGTGFPDIYSAYGHTLGTPASAVRCPLIQSYVTGDNQGSVNHTCAVDSLVVHNILMGDSRQSIFGTGNRQKANLSVAGGSENVRYYVTGGLTNETGTLQLPGNLVPQADSAGLPHSDFRPNTANQRSARANSVVKLTPKAELQVDASYMSTEQQAPELPGIFYGVYIRNPVFNASDNYGYGGAPFFSPAYQYGNLTNQLTNRLTGSLSFNWTPWTWLSGHASAGVDHGSQRFTAEILPQLNEYFYDEFGQLGITNGTNDVYSFDGRLTATAKLTSTIRAITSAGLQMVDSRSQSTYASSFTTTATNSTLNGSTSDQINQAGVRQGTLGGYLEEQLGLWERLFVTGAVRVDAGSNFGSGYKAIAYPKASISYLALTGGATTVRFRGAFGESGAQPPNGSALQLYGEQEAYLDHAATTVPVLLNIVNPNLRPERSIEFEGGADIGFWHDRVTLDLTAYGKKTDDALVGSGVGWEAGGYNSYENVGEVTNNGFEATLNASIVRGGWATWDVSLNASTNHNNLVKLAPGVQNQVIYGYYSMFRFAPGTPLYGYYGPKYHYGDANHDGIIESNEVTVEDTNSYLGNSSPTRTATFSSHIGLWRGLVTLGTLFDYRGGNRLGNDLGVNQAYVSSDRASNDPHAPLWEQARDVALSNEGMQGLDNGFTPQGFYEDASFVRFRELSATIALPARWARSAHVKTLSLTGAIRNVVLWTPYTGGDPEVTSSNGKGVFNQPTTNTQYLNRDFRENEDAVPLSRTFVIRLNAGF